jgi:hypothetical protein
MNGIKMSDCRFYVNEKERTVVCVIPRTRYMVDKFVKEHFRWNDIDFWRGSSNFYEMPSSFMGKAVCAESDTWDEETGRLIAFSRAKDKCYKSFFKRANKFVQTVDKRLGEMIELFNDFGMKLEDKREALQQKIDERVTKE